MKTLAKSAPAASGRRRHRKLIRPAVQLELFPAYVHCAWEQLVESVGTVFGKGGVLDES